MARSSDALAAFDRAVARLESVGSFTELEQALKDVVRDYPFNGASFSWWSYPPPSRAPDFVLAAGDVEAPSFAEQDRDLWSDSRPRIEAVPDANGVDPVTVRVALLGPRRRFGVLTAALSLSADEIASAEYDWKGRFLILAHMLQHHMGLWSPEERPNLGRREIQCLKLAAEGLKAKQIAITLGIGQQTVQFHLSRAREKLNCSNTVQAVARAAQFGLLPDIPPAARDAVEPGKSGQAP